MNFIGRDCVAFLFSTVLGTFIYLGAILRGMYKMWQLNPNDTYTGLECLEKLMDEAYALMGASASDVCDEDSDEGGCSTIEAIVLLLGCGMIWPVTVAIINQAVKNVCEQMRIEYDRGIRTRKEPS